AIELGPSPVLDCTKVIASDNTMIQILKSISLQFSCLLAVHSSTGLGPNSMAPGHNGAGLEVNNLMSGRISSRLVSTLTTPSVPPTEKQLSELFQPLFDEDEEFLPDVQPQLVNVATPCTSNSCFVSDLRYSHNLNECYVHMEPEVLSCRNNFLF
nr:hypothetical protein [Tanacetum cinerariifolium]